MTTKHHALGTQTDGIHTTLASRPANAAARGALTNFPDSPAFADAVDIGKLARDEDTGRVFMLASVGPAVWVEVTLATLRTLTAGAGMTGGGDLSADRTFDVAANADGSITVNANDIQVGVLATDAQHGARGGGTQHAVATSSVAGFESAAEYLLINGTTGTVTAVALGAGYIDVQTSAALLTVNNTARKVGVNLDIWETPANLIDMGDQLVFHVARLNDGSVFICCLNDGQTITGAVPQTLTGLTVDGEGWRFTVDASYQAVIGVARDAATNRWAQSTVWAETTRTRTCP